jgi:hypothetical protein
MVLVKLLVRGSQDIRGEKIGAIIVRSTSNHHNIQYIIIINGTDKSIGHRNRFEQDVSGR